MALWFSNFNPIKAFVVAERSVTVHCCNEDTEVAMMFIVGRLVGHVSPAFDAYLS